MLHSAIDRLPVIDRLRRRIAMLSALVLTVLSVQAVALSPASAADPAPREYQGPTFATAGPSPTEDKPQSKLWFHDGSWWALMRTNVNGSDGNPDVTVHRLQPDHTWLNTGTVVDGRAASTGDALWEDGKLYVASRVTSGSLQAARLSYNASSRTYSMDSGFPKSLTSGSIESTTIARDSRDRLWVTFTKPNPSNSAQDQVWVAHSTTSDTTWTAPFRVPVTDNVIAADDLSAIVAFGGKIGVMWSDQQSQAMRFAVHPDTAADNAGWTLETPVSGTRSADDHVNLKSLMEDDAGRVYAAIKTSRGDGSGDSPSDPGLQVLSRSSTGTWTATTVASVSENLTRPQLALDATNRQLYVVMSTESGGNIYYRRSPMGASLSFTPRTTLLNWTGARINNATTAKAPVTAASGLVVLASDERNTRRYYHAELDLPGGTPAGDTAAPSVPGGVTAVADGPTQVSVRWSASTDDVGVASYQVERDGAVVANAVTGTSFVDSAVAAGTQYGYTVSAVDAAGNRSAQSASVSVTTPSDGGGGDGGETGAVTAGAVTSASGATAATSVTVTRPAGLAEGDVLIAQITADSAPTISAAPAGWSTVVAPLSTYGARVFVYYKVVGTATEPASYTWTLSSAQKWNAAISSYSGVDGADPFDGAASTSVSNTSRSSVAVPSVTTTVAGAMVVGGVGVNSGGTSVTPPTDWTEAVEATGVQTTELAHVARPTTGATGTATWRLSKSIQAVGWLRALRPA